MQEEKFKEWLETSGLTDLSWNDDWYYSKTIDMFKFGNMIAMEYLNENAPGQEYSNLWQVRLSYFAGPGNNASYLNGLNMIYVNPSFSDSNTDVMLLLSHEATHHGQYLLSRTDPAQLSHDEQVHRGFITSTIQGHDSTVFGIDTNSRTYVVPQSWSGSSYYKEAVAMYVLSPGEREAREAEIRIQEMFGITDGRGSETGSARYEINAATRILRERYNCQNLTDEEIHKLFDNATINVTTGRIPTNPIEASMTYDLAVFVSRSSALSFGVEKKLDSQEKARALSTAGFENACTIGTNRAKEMTLSEILSLSPNEVEQNPHVIAHGICNFGLDAMCQSDAISAQFMNPEIGDSSFDRWYFSELNTLSSKQMTNVSLQLGQEYSEQNVRDTISRIDFVSIDVDSLFLDADANIDLDKLFSEDNSQDMDIFASYAHTIDWTDGCNLQADDIDFQIGGGGRSLFDQVCVLER